MNISAFNLFSGWSYGYDYSNSKKQENEIKQGANYYLAAQSVCLQVASLGGMVNKLNAFTPGHLLRRSVELLTFIGPALSIPTILFIASVKMGNYKIVALGWNTLSPIAADFLYNKAPKILKEKANDSAQSFVLHTGLTEKYSALRSEFKEKLGPNALKSISFLAKKTNQFVNLLMIPPKWVGNQIDSQIRSLAKKAVLPDELGVRSVRVINFLAEHTGTMIGVAMVTSSVALIALGNVYFGAASLMAIGYTAVDLGGFLPRRISLFMEKYMPLVSSLVLIVSGTFWVRSISVLTVAQYIPSVSWFINKKIDTLFNRFAEKIDFPIAGPTKTAPRMTLEEFDAPFIKQKKLNLGQIKTILYSHESEYEINPAHTSKWAVDLPALPENRNFHEYNNLFETVNWASKYRIVFKKLMNDKKFIQYLQKEATSDQFIMQIFTDFLSNPNNPRFENKGARCIEALAQKNGMTKEKYLVNYIKNQMDALVKKLIGVNRVDGKQTDLQEGIDNCSRILPYLQSIKESQPIEFEDALLKIAVEGGDYCGLGIKRMSSTLMDTVVQSQRLQHQIDWSVSGNYEEKLFIALQSERFRVHESIYLEYTMNGPEFLREDNHHYENYKALWGLGFTPLTTNEKNRFGILDLLIWKRLIKIRQTMMETYQKNLMECFKAGTNNEFNQYLNIVLSENSELSDDDREVLRNERAEGRQEKAYKRLILVMLGVLRKKQS
jgi:hypothetical protein